MIAAWVLQRLLPSIIPPDKPAICLAVNFIGPKLTKYLIGFRGKIEKRKQSLTLLSGKRVRQEKSWLLVSQFFRVAQKIFTDSPGDHVYAQLVGCIGNVKYTAVFG
jgi:hypothetical protein